MSASPQDLMTAKLFFNAAFPTMQVLLDDDPKLHKKFQNFNATVQFGAMNDGELLCCHLIFQNGNLTVVQGPAEKSDISLTFSSVEKMNSLLKGGLTMHEGTDLTIITCGIGVLQAVNAAKTLAETDGLSVRVINMHTIKPIDREAIMSAVTDTRRILTVEEHNVLGGLGDAVASVIAESGKGCVFKKHGMQDTFATIGYAEDLYSYYQFDANGIVDKVREMMGMEFEPDENWDDE